MPVSPVPSSESEQIPWLTNFSPKLANYAATLGLQPAEVTAIQADVSYLIYLLNVRLPHERQTLAATVEYKNFMKEGDAALPLPATLPGTVAPPAYPAPVLPGALNRIRKLVLNIKTRAGYTETIGQDLGIIAVDSSATPDAPTLSLVNANAGNVTLAWNKSGWTGVKIQSRTGSGDWQDVGVDLYSPFVDTRPLTVANQPEKREYRASYLDGDAVMTGTSQVLEVTVGA